MKTEEEGGLDTGVIIIMVVVVVIIIIQYKSKKGPNWEQQFNLKDVDIMC